ncbi:MAG: hypothetical protein GY822_05310 [Deltaproteobacteria bacterium]|nr:hypothetical protein [Deltaproteobacteria bacterium]
MFSMKEITRRLRHDLQDRHGEHVLFFCGRLQTRLFFDDDGPQIELLEVRSSTLSRLQRERIAQRQAKPLSKRMLPKN